MLTLRLPVDARGQGLAERPSPFLPCPETSLPASCPSGEMSGIEPALSESERDAMVEQLEIACRFGAVVERVAARHGLLPSIIAGFCSRRSGWGQCLSPAGSEGTGDFQARERMTDGRRSSLPPDGLGFRRGLMGLDYDDHMLARGECWRDPETNLDVAFTLVAEHRTHLRRRTTLQGPGLLRASLTAFECGLRPVERAIRFGLDVDSPTIGWRPDSRGCGQDVLARAGVFQAEGWD